ncbi:hypothetical protein AB0E08_45255 [Streptomyces sp. NPDC048281]|uniref:hypothetical protein n=1 Tax=Streptomyces sp. NPDC048281 TaxID=3154715 RepID=UPI00342D6125
MSVLAVLLESRADLSGALRATGEAVELYRGHADMSAVFPRRRSALSRQAQLLDGLGRESEAAQVRRWLDGNPLG